MTNVINQKKLKKYNRGFLCPVNAVTGQARLSTENESLSRLERLNVFCQGFDLIISQGFSGFGHVILSGN